ncbi:tetratricopeptide repeat protein [Undibacterium amnicola]|uniref:Tetratricopeptide repeat protein n=1 Tax=Undibacterium amnicola TaxID=1834038 RepID=A0ABR6XT80_9BURK|nr:tetratricopeptide repeat protein [Undibacterium amnicola]MBC3832710.1 tetratricopeptide repeat protein [Undibacterium amnicola]
MTLFSLSALFLLLIALSFIVFGLRRAENGQSIFSEDDTVANESTSSKTQSLCLLLTISVIFLASFLYAIVGNPKAIDAAKAKDTEAIAPFTSLAADAQMTPEKIEAMVAGLAKKMESNPDDAKGWRMLARSYETLRRFPQAIEAYKNLVRIQPNDAEIWTDYAVTLAMASSQTLVGEPEQLIARALRIDPNYVQALALYGSAAFEHKDYAVAITTWKNILKNAEPDSDIARSIQAGIDKAELMQRESAQ